MSYRILLSGGGTAGSVTPLIALAEAIRRRRRDVEFLFVGTTFGPEKDLVQKAGLEFRAITSGKFRRYWSGKNITDIWRIWRGYGEAKKILQDWQPQVAVTAGSFVSVPLIWAAQRQGIATLVHQQDVRPGLANRLMVPGAKKITAAFQSTIQAFGNRPTVWIGNPVRPEILAGDSKQAAGIFHLEQHVPVLLVLGGGTGSATLNNVIEQVAGELVKDWTIIHLTGPKREPTKFRHPRYQQFPSLFSELPHALAAADVVISRAGLGAISELAALGKAVIFIPMPGTHQEDNAAMVANSNGAIVLHQPDQIATKLPAAVERLRQNPSEAQQLGLQLKQLYRPDALSRLADETLALLRP